MFTANFNKYNNVNIDISKYAKGIYFVEMSNAHNTHFTDKLIIE